MMLIELFMEFFRKGSEGVEPNATLIVATVSIGNVGQFTCESLLRSFPHELVGYLFDPNVLPCFGHDPFPTTATSALSLELYQLKESQKPIYILQQRAPAQLGRQRAFAKNLAEWISQQVFETVLLSSSIEATIQRDAQIQQRRCWYLHCRSQAIPELDRFGFLPLEDTEELMARSLPPWPLLMECRERSINAVVILSFTVEGDNLADAVEQTQRLLPYLGLDSEKQMGIV